MVEESISIGTGLTVLGMAFTAWAFVVAWGVGVVRREVAEIKGQLHATATAQATHVNQTERRLTMLETEFGYLRRLSYRIAKRDTDNDDDENLEVS